MTALNERILKAIQKMILDVLTTLGPFITALMPASFTFIAVHDMFGYKGETISLILAILAALSIESVGIVTSHRAVDMYNAADKGLVQPVKFKISLFLIPVYVLSVVGIMLFAREFFDSLSLAIGIASPFMTLAVYIAMALGRDADGLEEKIIAQETSKAELDAAQVIRAQVIEDDERAHKQKMERVNEDNKHALKLARESFKSSVQDTVQKDVQDTVQKDVKGTVQSGVQDIKGTVQNVQSKIEKLDTLRQLKLDNPNLGATDLARRLGVARQTIYNYEKELAETNGSIS